MADPSSIPVREILIVEDNPADVFMLEKRLAGAPDVRFNIRHVGTLQETLSILKEHRFDIILLDLNLSDSERMQTVRGVVGATDAAIIVMTSQPDENLAVKAIQAGIQDFISKERLQSADLLNSIRFALERQIARNRLHSIAYRDELTGLSNRNAFAGFCMEALAKAGTGERMALHIIHIRTLKELVINDGLHVAEAVLKSAASRLYGLFQSGRIFARLESDNLGLFQMDVSHDGHALYIARRVFEILSTPIEAMGQTVTLETCIGISLFPDHGSDFDTLYHFAALALEQAERKGANSSCIYDSAAGR